MVTRTAVIEGHEQTVITPIIKNIVDNIQKKFIKDPDTFNYLITKYEKENVDVPDFTYDNTLGGPTLDIDYEYKPIEELNVRTSRMYPLARPILYDKETKFTVTPYFQQHEINIHLQFRSQSKQELINLKNKLYSYFINTDYRLILNLPFSFQLPLSVLFLANDIKTLKEFNGSVNEYLKSIQTGHLDFSLKRGWKELEIPYFRGVQVSRYCNILTPPEEMIIEKNDVPEYKINFDLVTTFHLPMGVFVDIPMLVFNKPVDSKWLGREPGVVLVDKEENELNITKAISDYYFGRKTIDDILFKYPSNDDFSVATDPNHYFRNIKWLSILITVDKDNPKYLFNLNDLKLIGVPSPIIEYMKKHREYLHRTGGAGIKIDLFEYNNLRDKGLYVDENLDVRTTEDLDIDKIYHVVLKFVVDINILKDLDEEGINETIELFNKYGIFWFKSEGEIVRHKNGLKGD